MNHYVITNLGINNKNDFDNSKKLPGPGFFHLVKINMKSKRILAFEKIKYCRPEDDWNYYNANCMALYTSSPLLQEFINDIRQFDTCYFVHGISCPSKVGLGFIHVLHQKYIASPDNPGFEMLVGMLWISKEVSPMSDKEYYADRERGKKFAPIVTCVLSNINEILKSSTPTLAKSFLMTQSSGNLILQIMLNTWRGYDPAKNANPVFNKLFMMAADIELDYFYKWTKDDVKRFCKRLYVFYFAADVPLGHSQKTNDSFRLGLHPMKENNAGIQNIDVTDTHDDKSLAKIKLTADMKEHFMERLDYDVDKNPHMVHHAILGHWYFAYDMDVVEYLIDEMNS